MAQKWYQKATVQAALAGTVVAGVFGIIVALISSSSKNAPVKDVHIGSVGALNIIEVRDLIPLHKAETHPKMPQENTQLALVIEEAANYANSFMPCGLSVSFSLTNKQNDTITIHSIKMEVTSFWPDSSPQFKSIRDALPEPILFYSAAIIVHGFRVNLDHEANICEVWWGIWDDSADSRALTFKRTDPHNYKKMLELIEKAMSKASVLNSEEEFELLPPALRFSQEPGESDSFHGLFNLKQEGIVQFSLCVSYQTGGKIYKVWSKDELAFTSVRRSFSKQG